MYLRLRGIVGSLQQLVRKLIPIEPVISSDHDPSLTQEVNNFAASGK